MPDVYLVTELHLLEYHRARLEYLQEFEANKPTPFRKRRLLSFSDPTGYSDGSITSDMVTEVLLKFSERTRRRESSDYLRVLTGLSSAWY